MHPGSRDKIRTLVFLGWFARVTFVPAALLIGFWFLIQLLSIGTVADVQSGGVAYMAHVGGIVFGAVAARLKIPGAGRPGALKPQRESPLEISTSSYFRPPLLSLPLLRVGVCGSKRNKGVGRAQIGRWYQNGYSLQPRLADRPCARSLPARDSAIRDREAAYTRGAP
jgi:hypothetical protein